MTDKEESLVSHLEDLRKSLLKSIICVAIFLPLTFIFSPTILSNLTKILLKDNKIVLNYFTPIEVFLIQLKIALIVDIIICFPYIVKNLWEFILPALYDNERKFIKNIIISSSILFFFGALFSLFIILPLIINFGISFSNENIKAVFGISNIINLALNLSFMFGLMFQVPLITYLLIKWGVLSYDCVISKRPYVVILLLIISAILTPPDIISQILLFTPTYLLFELSLFFSKPK